MMSSRSCREGFFSLVNFSWSFLYPLDITHDKELLNRQVVKVGLPGVLVQLGDEVRCDLTRSLFQGEKLGTSEVKWMVTVKVSLEGSDAAALVAPKKRVWGENFVNAVEDRLVDASIEVSPLVVDRAGRKLAGNEEVLEFVESPAKFQQSVVGCKYKRLLSLLEPGFVTSRRGRGGAPILAQCWCIWRGCLGGPSGANGCVKLVHKSVHIRGDFIDFLAVFIDRS